MSTARSVSMVLLAALALGACDVVDETGYECPDGMWVASPYDCFYGTEADNTTDFPEDTTGDSAGGPNVPGAAELGVDPSLITWTSQTEPTPGPASVIILGLEGAVPEGAEVTLTVDRGATTLALVSGGSFVGTVQASVGSVVSVVVGVNHVADLTIGALRGADTDAVGAVDLSVGAAATPGSATRTLDVGDGALPLPAPYVVFDLTSGATVAVAVGDTVAQLTASAGDEVCLAQVLAFAGLGPASCSVLP